MVEYKKNPRDSAFQRFQTQALAAQKKTQTKAPSYGQIQQNVAQEREKRVDATDNRIKGLEQESKEKVAKAVDTSAWEAPKQKSVTQTSQQRQQSDQAPTAQPAGRTSTAPTAAGSTEGDYRSKLVKETEGRIQEAQKSYEDSQKKLQDAEAALAKDLEEAQKERVYDVGQQSELEARSEAINRMLAQGVGGAGALGAMEQYNINYDPRFAALESMGQQGRLNLAREQAAQATVRDEEARAAQTRAAEDYLSGLQRIQEGAQEQFRTREDEMREQAEQEREDLLREREQYLDQGYTDAEIDRIREFEDRRAGGLGEQERLANQLSSLEETFGQLGGQYAFREAMEGGPERAAELKRNFNDQIQQYLDGTHPDAVEARRRGYEGARLQNYIKDRMRNVELIRDRLDSLERYMYDKRKADEAAGMTYEDYQKQEQDRQNRRKALSRITGGV